MRRELIHVVVLDIEPSEYFRANEPLSYILQETRVAVTEYQQTVRETTAQFGEFQIQLCERFAANLVIFQQLLLDPGKPTTLAGLQEHLREETEAFLADFQSELQETESALADIQDRLLQQTRATLAELERREEAELAAKWTQLDPEWETRRAAERESAEKAEYAEHLRRQIGYG
jgi:hypothetical protein